MEANRLYIENDGQQRLKVSRCLCILTEACHKLVAVSVVLYNRKLGCVYDSKTYDTSHQYIII